MCLQSRPSAKHLPYVGLQRRSALWGRSAPLRAAGEDPTSVSMLKMILVIKTLAEGLKVVGT